MNWYKYQPVNYTFANTGTVTSSKSDKKTRPVSTGRRLKSLDAVDRYERLNQFFGMRGADSDEVLLKLGISRHELKKLTYDETVYQCIDIISQEIKGGRYTLTPSEGKPADALFKALDNNLDKIVDAGLNAWQYGYSVCEYAWVDSEEGYIIDDVVEVPMQWFDPTRDNKLIFYSKKKPNGVTVDTKYKFLLQRNKPSFENPKGEAVFSRIFWAVEFKEKGEQFWCIFLERLGSPIIIGHTDSDTQAIADALASAHAQASTGIGQEEKVTVVEAGKASSDGFKIFNDLYTKKIVKVLLGQTLTSGTDTGGTYGQGMVHEKQQERKINGIKAQIKKAFQHFVDAMCEVNGWERHLFDWVNEKGIQKDRAERDAILADKLGYVFNKEYGEDIYDLEAQHFDIRKEVDVTPSQPNAFKASALQFNAKKGTPRFTKEQQRLETLADDAINAVEPPISTDTILQMAKQTNNEEDFLNELFNAVGRDLSTDEIENALFVSEILGHVDSAVGV